MPLHPQAAFISDPGRASKLFPPTPCRQCSGTGKIQRYATAECDQCRGTGQGDYHPENAPPGDPGHCSKCWSDFAKKSMGKLGVPETIPCPGCNGQGTKRRVNDARPQNMGQMKPGDWVVIGVEFPALPMEDVDTKYVSASAELISCMVIRCGTSALIIARVLQSPEYSAGHGLKYGDLLQLGPNNILIHNQATPEEFDKAKAGGLFTFAPVNPIQPVPGREFITRGGERATVWTLRTEGQGQFAIGISKGGVNLEWNLDGTERQGHREFDLIQFAQVVNA